ncbi:hypothetical protein CXIVA_07770 [Clostridium sp. SY8519]|uniref:plasmid mobilization protein n=1 Tax=Clostridium sp. (strain SY8519) TaxID=1042156 RepID=UPI0002172025|nr:plasmid mobilization relaxosome protein MobC [Clostridium sp. SY8519]BAK46744.1 hypothetical protein CXIVA_07770 [Clostridium sp. SY8519]
MRKRNCSLLLRATPAERDTIKQKAVDAGISLQQYMLQSSLYGKSPSAEEIEELKTLSKILADYDLQLKGIGTNINQTAYVANCSGKTPDAEELTRLGVEVQNIRKECGKLWLLLRSLLAGKVR